MEIFSLLSLIICQQQALNYNSQELTACQKMCQGREITNALWCYKEETL